MTTRSVFVSYRRGDAAGHAGRLVDRLEAHLGDKHVFFDMDTIVPGEDFEQAILHRLQTCDIALIIIGPRWLEPSGAGVPKRLDDPTDHVRREVDLALTSSCRVVPVLVGGGRMPSASELPEELVPLSTIQAFTLEDEGFHAAADRLLELLAATPTPTRTPATGNLPAPVSTFVGRGDELDELRRLLSQHRLVTLTGAGGAGKTRLAVELAQLTQERFSDGAWFVSLVDLRDGTLIPETVARPLGVEGGEGLDPVDHLVRVMRDRELLLVIDNCEHLADPTADVLERLLHGCPALRVVATSREALQLEGEVRVDVKPLALPEDANVVDAPSVQLFLERAKMASPSFRPSNDEYEIIAEICRAVDGLPLAIELVAAQLGSYSLNELGERLRVGLDAPRARRRGGSEHHRTMAAAIAWSYELLDDAQRTIFRRLAIFRGGWTAQAAIDICGRGTGDDVGRIMDDLAAASLIVTLQQDDAAKRFRMLEPIRHFALGQLEKDPEHGELVSAHADWFGAFAARAAPERLVSWATAMTELTVDLDNLRAAMARSIETGEPRAAAMVVDLFWLWTKMPEEGPALLAEISRGDVNLDARARARLLAVSSVFSFFSGSKDEAFDEATRAIALAPDDPTAVPTALTTIGSIYRDRGDREAAVRAHEEALELATATGSSFWTARSLYSLGAVAQYDGHYADAIERFREALNVMASWSEPSLLLEVRNALARVALEIDDIELAEAQIDQALRLNWEETLATDRGETSLSQGLVHLRRGELDAAAEQLRASIRLPLRAGFDTGGLEADQSLASLAAAELGLGRPRDALNALVACQRVIELSGRGWSESVRVRFEETAARIRASLGADFDDMWAKAAVIPLGLLLDQVIDPTPAADAR